MRRLGSRCLERGGTMNVVRPLQLLSGSLAIALAIGALGATAAEAKPTKPGGPTGLAVDSVVASASGTSFSVAVHWNAVSGATKYRVAVTRSGATLASATVTPTSWSGTLTASPGDVTVGVRAVAVHKPGPTSSITVNLPDVVAPTGSYSSAWDNNTGVATLTQDSLTDNAPVGQVTRTVNWDDGGPTEAWTTGTTLNHTYPLTAQRYVPTVTLEDAAHNSRVVHVPAVVINDLTAPTGTFAVTPASAWAKLTQVTLTQSALSDNWSPQAKITRSVDWGDGTPATAWTTGATLSHVYAVGGSFTPKVTVTDEAQNAAQIATSAVVVNVDSAAPVVRLAAAQDPQALGARLADPARQGHRHGRHRGEGRGPADRGEARDAVVRLPTCDPHLGQGVDDGQGVRPQPRAVAEDQLPAPLVGQGRRPPQGHAGLSGEGHRQRRQHVTDAHAPGGSHEAVRPAVRRPSGGPRAGH